MNQSWVLHIAVVLFLPCSTVLGNNVVLQYLHRRSDSYVAQLHAGTFEMNQLWVLHTAVVLLFPCSTVLGNNVFLNYLHRRSDSYVAQLHADPHSTGSCKVDPYNRSFTIRNLKYYCNYRQLRNIFSSLSAGAYPVGRLKGHTILGSDDYIESIWMGKNFYYPNGAGHSGTVTNALIGSFDFLTASIYRTIAPLDGKDVFAIDYRNDIFATLMVDFLRQIQDNLYLGVITFRGFETIPLGYFFLEIV